LWLWLAVAVALALGALFLVADSRVSAQGETRQFKVGDRVDVDTFSAGSEKYATWREGKIIRLDNPDNRFGAYIIKLDKDGSEFRVRFVDMQFIRAPQETAAKTIDDNKPGDRTEANQTTTQPKATKAETNQTTEFKAGDRVQVDVLMISTSSPAEMQLWKDGTVTQVDRREGYRPVYVVQVDPLPGELPKVFRIPIKPNATERVWIRAGGGAAPNIPTDKLRVDENDTVLANREVLDCGHRDQPPARNGSPLPAEEAKKLIRCALGEHPSPVGGQGATAVDISQFAIGAPRKWNLRTDTGAGGTADTIVYPVRVKYTTKSFYREQNKVTSDREQLFACHVDVGRWICGPDQVLKEGEKVQIQVKKE
jgi:hypothetical protein